jgi:hypothetical protein
MEDDDQATVGFLEAFERPGRHRPGELTPVPKLRKSSAAIFRCVTFRISPQAISVNRFHCGSYVQRSV